MYTHIHISHSCAYHYFLMFISEQIGALVVLYTYTHTYIHTYIHLYTHTYVHLYTYAHICTHTHAHTHTHRHTCMSYACAYHYFLIHAYMYTHKHISQSCAYHYFLMFISEQIGALVVLYHLMKLIYALKNERKNSQTWLCMCSYVTILCSGYHLQKLTHTLRMRIKMHKL